MTTPGRKSPRGTAGSRPPRNHLARAREVFDIEIAALRSVRGLLDDSFNQAVDLAIEALDAGGKLVVSGVGKSGAVGAKIAATLSSTGSPAVVLNALDAWHGDLGVVNRGDVVLGLSYSGESEELVRLLPALKRLGMRLIAFTGTPGSTLGKRADVVLACPVPREACDFNLAPTSSTTAMLALGDAFALALMRARGFQKSDFALRHPGGAIGRALLATVGEIMRTGVRNAVATETTLVREALLVMTRARSGSVAVVDRHGRLSGVFTDGDLRRKMAADPQILDRRLKDAMTPEPVRIQSDALAAEALRIFDERAIDDLIVVDAKGRPVGLVDSQDLPKMKLM
jgi:arabinose-5-phosphate isomerase